MKTTIVLLLLVAFIAAVFADTIDLQPGQWIPNIHVVGQQWNSYYKMSVPAGTREVRVRMDKTSPAGTVYDPDLYVRFDANPDKNNWDGRDETHLASHEVSIDLTSRTPYPTTTMIGLYGHLGEGVVRLRGDVYQCPNRNCGAENSGGTCDIATGTCTCAANFNAFPDCSAQTIPASFAADIDGTLTRGKTVFYKFDAPAVIHGYESMSFTVERTQTEASYSAYVVRIQRGRFPTEDDYLAESSGAQTFQRVFVPSSEFSEGAWYVSVTSTFASLSYTIKSSIMKCPNGCSNHGTCNEETGICACETGYTFSRDCSLRSDALQPNEPQVITIKPKTSVAFTAEVSKAWATAPVELGIHLDIENAPVDVALPTVYIRYLERPHDVLYDYKSPSPVTANSVVYVPKTRLQEGVYYVLIENTQAYEFKASIAWNYHRDCPDECNAHGRCTATGTCACNEGWYGTNCSIKSGSCEYVEPAKEKKKSTVETPVAIFIGFATAVATLVATLFAAKKFFPAPQQPTPEINFNG